MISHHIGCEESTQPTKHVLNCTHQRKRNKYRPGCCEHEVHGRKHNGVPIRKACCGDQRAWKTHGKSVNKNPQFSTHSP